MTYSDSGYKVVFETDDDVGLQACIIPGDVTIHLVEGDLLLVFVAVGHRPLLVNAVEVLFGEMVYDATTERVALYVHGGTNSVPGEKRLQNVKTNWPNR